MIKKITAGVAWAIGVFFLSPGISLFLKGICLFFTLPGISLVFLRLAQGVVFLGTSAFFIPPVVELIEEKWNVTISVGLRIIIIISCVAAVSALESVIH